MAYEPSTYIYKGKWSVQLKGMIAAGTILELDLSSGLKNPEEAKGLAEALASKTCRVSLLGYVRWGGFGG